MSNTHIIKREGVNDVNHFLLGEDLPLRNASSRILPNFYIPLLDNVLVSIGRDPSKEGLNVSPIN
jgi:hypothetical protein